MKISIIDAQKMAEDKGGRCLSKKYKNQQKDKMLWKCSLGHTWSSLYISVLRGSWCPECSDSHKYIKRYDISDAKKIAKEAAGECLSDSYKNNITKLKWKCSVGHEWESTFSSIVNGKTWCPKCSKTKKLTLSDAINTANSNNGGMCLSKEYKNDSTLMKWRCSLGHIWDARFHDVRSGHWCPSCSGVKRLTLQHATDIASKKGGKCLSTKYENVRKKIKWECCAGHKWEASLNNVKYNKSWCPRCKRNNGKQAKLYNILCNLFPTQMIEQNYRGFNWLKTKNTGKQEIDIFIYSKDGSFSIAVEYQGEQHFLPIRFGGISNKRATQNLKYVKRLDKIKKRKILNHTDDVKYFIEFTYMDTIDTRCVVRRLEDNGIFSDCNS